MAVTVIGAVIGVAVTVVVQRARPTATVVFVDTSLGANGRFVTERTEVAVPERLKKLLGKSLWTSTAAFRGIAQKYERFIEALDDNEERMKRYVRSVGKFQADAPRMRQILERGPNASEDEVFEFYDLWERNDGFVYGSILGEHRRGRLALSERDYEEIEPTYSLAFVADPGIWTVKRTGARFGTTLFPDDDRDLPFQERVMFALAFFDADVLTRLLDTVKQDIRSVDADLPDQVLGEIDQTRALVSRWAVTVSVENPGGKTISILPYATMTVKTDGLLDNGTAIRGDTPVTVELRNDQGEPEAVHIEPGGARLLTFASTNFVRDHARAETLLRAYELGANVFHVEMATAGGGWFVANQLDTDEARFVPAGEIAQET